MKKMIVWNDNLLIFVPVIFVFSLLFGIAVEYLRRKRVEQYLKFLSIINTVSYCLFIFISAVCFATRFSLMCTIILVFTFFFTFEPAEIHRTLKRLGKDVEDITSYKIKPFIFVLSSCLSFVAGIVLQYFLNK